LFYEESNNFIILPAITMSHTRLYFPAAKNHRPFPVVIVSAHEDDQVELAWEAD